MAIHIDEQRRVVIRLGLFYTLLVAVISAALFVGMQLQKNNEILSQHEERLDLLETEYADMRATNAEIRTGLAVINTKLTNIESQLLEVKAEVKSLEGR